MILMSVSEDDSHRFFIIIIIIIIILPVSIWFKKLSLVAYNSVNQLFQGMIQQQWVLWVQTWPAVQRMVSLSEQETLNRVHVIIDDRYWTEHKQFQGLREIGNCITIIKSPSTRVVNFQTSKTCFNHAQFQNNSKITQKKKPDTDTDIRFIQFHSKVCSWYSGLIINASSIAYGKRTMSCNVNCDTSNIIWIALEFVRLHY